MIWNAPTSRRALTDLASSSSGLYTLSVRKLNTLDIPVPPLPEQAAIVKQVKATRESRQALNRALDGTSRRVSALRRALLNAAFSGRLTGTAPTPYLSQELAHV